MTIEEIPENDQLTPLEQRLLSLAKRIWPSVAALSGQQRVSGVADVTGVLYLSPLALVGVVWLVLATDLSTLFANWPVLLMMFGLMFLFNTLSFFTFVEIAPEAYWDWGASMEDIVTWSAALLFGPSALWLPVLFLLFRQGVTWPKAVLPRLRWSIFRNLLSNLVVATFVSLVPLSLYARWGGTFPLLGLCFAQILPALCAMAAYAVLFTLVHSPFSVYFTVASRLQGRSWWRALRFWATVIGWQVGLGPVAIFAAGLYVERVKAQPGIAHGLGWYLPLMAVLLAASALAHRLSLAAERSHQRSRELEQLEQLGEAIIAGPPDASTLPALLARYVPPMFPYTQTEIRIFPDQIILRHGRLDSQVLMTGALWEWTRSNSTPCYVHAGESPPWQQAPVTQATLVVPVMEAGHPTTDKPVNPTIIGGICLSRSYSPTIPEDIDDLIPSVQTLAAQIASALHSAEIYEQTLTHERLAQEVALAGQIQASFLPQDLPQLPGWQLAALLTPAKQTAGDFYDIFTLSNGYLALVIADVADKGVGPALYMALSRTLIRSYAERHPTSPDAVLRVANRRILHDTQAGLFVTVFYGVLDPKSGRLRYCNAGHNPPYWFHTKEPGAVESLRRTGMALGVIEDTSWEPGMIQLSPGDTLVLYTDGITEAQNAQGAFFGTERLLSVIRAHIGETAQEIQEAIMGAVAAFVGDALPFDDITLMVLLRE